MRWDPKFFLKLLCNFWILSSRLAITASLGEKATLLYRILPNLISNFYNGRPSGSALRTQNFEYKLARSAAGRSTQAVKQGRHIGDISVGSPNQENAMHEIRTRWSNIQRES